MNKITAKNLIELNICEVELSKFRKLFPRGARLDENNLEKAINSNLNLSWLANKVLRGDTYTRIVDESCLTALICMEPRIRQLFTSEALRSARMRGEKELQWALGLATIRTLERKKTNVFRTTRR